MHDSVMTWVRDVAVRLNLQRGKKILEVGSYNENGSVRELFEQERYIGVDMREGPGVNHVLNAHLLDGVFDSATFDVVICTEMLEHDDRFWVSMRKMGYVLRRDGVLIVTTRGNGFPLHAYPDDYYRFMLSAAEPLCEMAGCALIESHEDPQQPGIFFYGIRR